MVSDGDEIRKTTYDAVAFRNESRTNQI
jgi:hypothetical protein